MNAGNRRLKHFIAAFVLLASLTTCVGGMAEEGFLAEITQQWSRVKDTQISPDTERQSFRLLRLVMDGIFLEETEDELDSRILAAAFPLLAGIHEEDVPAFAKAYRMPEVMVDQAWWLSLANALMASLQMEPSEPQGLEEGLLNQWLGLSNAGATEVDEDVLLKIAGEYGLPLRFVRFLAGGSTQGGQAIARPAETPRSDQIAVIPAPDPGNGPHNGAEDRNQHSGGQDNGARSPEKRR